jgi:hypothetical protein
VGMGERTCGDRGLGGCLEAGSACVKWCRRLVLVNADDIASLLGGEGWCCCREAG